MKELFGMAVLLALWLLGEALAKGLSLPIPGSVIGMMLLFLALLCNRRIPLAVSSAADVLLKYLALLFVPAGVGIMVYGELMLSMWQPLLLALMGLVLLTLLGTAVVMALCGWFGGKGDTLERAGENV